ncbi:MAG: hypothetical protein AUG49_18990 [Catenulispora sp. 13_1_20CM_3_70_7]|nr:MAG: hypothetical protein AUG49_18990 [Catenulispora sp. 13_1_20CM_3_70_7]
MASGVAVVARWWHDTGAAHSIGDAVGAGGVAFVAAAAGAGVSTALAKAKAMPEKVARRLRRVVEMCIGVGAGAVGVGIIGYVDAPQPALITWGAGCVLGIIVNGHQQRTERRRWENALIQDRRETRDAHTRIRLAEIRKDEIIGQARELGDAWTARQMAQNGRPVFQQIINTGGGGVPFAPPQHLAEILNGGDRILAAVEPAADILSTDGVDDEPEPSDDARWLPDWISQSTTTQDQASA